jgi:alpha-amylase/alpha-mannosidase (GH57 family)
MADVYHALGLHMHQPLGNLLSLHQTGESWEAKQILWCYDRPTRMLEGYEDVARLHLSFSGTLLKQLEDDGIRQTFRDTVNIAEILERYRRSNIEFVGSGLYHPVYPLTPAADWDAQTEWWQGLGRHLLGRDRFAGFWPPEMGFCMEMIPMLKRHGYQYVLVDSIYLKPQREMRWEELRYRPYLARYGGAEIVIVPRDRELSNAQLSGLDPGWFQHEVMERTKWCDFPALVTTWTDGENGGWFRTAQVESGFWGFFLRPILDRYRAGTLGFKPVHISEYLRLHPPTEEVEVHRGAWNTEHHWGGDFTQWTGSLLQKKGWDEVKRASEYYWEMKKSFDRCQETLADREEVRNLILRAYDRLLTAETSCNFYWGSRWVSRSFDDLEQSYYLLDTARARMGQAR